MESLGVDLFAGASRCLASASVAHEEAPGGLVRGFSGFREGTGDGQGRTVTGQLPKTSPFVIKPIFSVIVVQHRYC